MSELAETKWEPLSKNCKILVTKEHGFTTDTILLADFALPKREDVCADIGTGCGTIPLLWAMRTKAQKIYGVEIQENAANQAKYSVKENGLENEIEILKADARSYKEIFGHGCLDLISCNPPYQAAGAGLENISYSRFSARHEISLTMEDLAACAAFALRFGGRLCICQRPTRLAEAIGIFTKYRLEPKRMRLVQQKSSSMPSLFLLEFRSGGKSGMVIEPTLIVRNDDGTFSAEMEKIYGDYRENAECKNWKKVRFMWLEHPSEILRTSRRARWKHLKM